MKPLKPFMEYLDEGIVRKQSPDLSRAKSLIKGDEDSYDFLNTVIKNIGINNKNANTIVKNAYDVIMEIIRAKMLTEGFNSSGQGAHEAEIAYLKELGFRETHVQFANQLRYFRNGILYYGKTFDRDYAQKVISFLEKIYTKLKKL